MDRIYQMHHEKKITSNDVLRIVYAFLAYDNPKGRLEHEWVKPEAVFYAENEGRLFDLNSMPDPEHAEELMGDFFTVLLTAGIDTSDKKRVRISAVRQKDDTFEVVGISKRGKSEKYMLELLDYLMDVAEGR